MDISRLRVHLRNTGLSAKDNPLYQFLNGLLDHVQTATTTTTTTPSGGGGSTTINNITNITEVTEQNTTVINDENGGEESLTIPGPQGPIGPSGPTGPMGPMGAIIWAEEPSDSEVFPPIIGPMGSQGPTGIQGPTGPMMFPDGPIDPDSIIQIFQSSGGGSGKIAQVVNTETGAVATGTTVIPFDDTIPQNTEGDQYMSLAITPTNSSSTLIIQVVAVLSDSAQPQQITAALFQDSTANALAAATMFTTIATGMVTITFTHKMAAGTTSSTTFKVRAGPSGAATITFNGQSGGRIYGGVLASSITITEVTP